MLVVLHYTTLQYVHFFDSYRTYVCLYVCMYVRMYVCTYVNASSKNQDLCTPLDLRIEFLYIIIININYVCISYVCISYVCHILMQFGC